MFIYLNKKNVIIDSATMLIDVSQIRFKIQLLIEYASCAIQLFVNNMEQISFIIILELNGGNNNCQCIAGTYQIS